MLYSIRYILLAVSYIIWGFEGSSGPTKVVLIGRLPVASP